jgi:hypothetical protein
MSGWSSKVAFQPATAFFPFPLLGHHARNGSGFWFVVAAFRFAAGDEGLLWMLLLAMPAVVWTRRFLGMIWKRVYSVAVESEAGMVCGFIARKTAI